MLKLLPTNFIRHFIRLVAFLVVIVLVAGQNIVVQALSQDDLNSIYNDTVWYETDSGSSSGCLLPGAVSGTLPSTVPEPYNSLFTKASATYNINPQFLASIFLSEQGNTWKPFDTVWATSPAGASGPFQFMPATWDAYAVDGNNDGVKDKNNIYDATYAAANMLHSMSGVNTPLGTLNAPFKWPSLLYDAGAYNWGPGNMQAHTTPTSPLSVVPTETQNYIKNVYTLITSGFTKSGNPNYPDPKPGKASASGTSQPASGCSGGIVAGSIAQTAVGLAWPQPPASASPPRDPMQPTDSYREAVNKFFASAPSDGADCGAFVGIVMHASGADSNYPISGTSAQQTYAENHPAKYQVLTNISNTSSLQPGDILIVNQGGGTNASGHTMIYVGPQSGGYNEASASMGSRMPSLGNTPAGLQDELGRGHYIVVRLK